MVTDDLLTVLDAAYAPLEARRDGLVRALTQAGFRVSSGWYNGHYRQVDGAWHKDAYPIPVVEAAGLCDVELSFDGTSVSAKLSRQAALEYDYGKLAAYSFEVFGVEDYLLDFYRSGRPMEGIGQAISRSGEEEVGVAFSFPDNVEPTAILDLLRFLAQEGFYN